MMYPIRLVFLILAIVVTWNLEAQISGILIDAEGKEPIGGAVISSVEEQTVSSPSGTFSLRVSDSAILVISHLGYQTKRIPASQVSKGLYILMIPDYTHLEQVTIRGPLLQNKLMNLPSSISMLYSHDLGQTQGITYVEELNRLPGVFVHSGTINTNRVTIRGIGSRTPYGTTRIKAYFNDIPLTSGDGTTSIEDIDPALIKTVEIIKGSKSAIYGSGLGGIIILSGREYFEEGLHASAGLEAGSFGTLNPQLSFHYKKGSFSSSAAYSFARSDGWRQNSSYYRHSANLITSLKTKRNKTDVLFHIIDMKAYIPSSLNKETFYIAPDNAAQNWLDIKGFEEYRRLLNGIRNEYFITDRLSNIGVMFFNSYNGYESRPFNILDDDAIQGGLKSIMNYRAGIWRFRAGIELMLEKYSWYIFETLEGFPGEQENAFSEIRTPLSFFLHSAYSFKNGGIVEAGLNYNFLSYRVSDKQPNPVDQSGNFQYKPVLSPFLGANFPLGSIVRLYASLGHGFSYPSVEETLLPKGQTNPDLKHERGVNMELGTRMSAFNGKLFADANVYLLLVDDLLVTERESEAVFYGRNAGKTNHMGVEVSACLRLKEKNTNMLPQTRLDVSMTLTNNYFTDFTDEGIDYAGNSLPGVPSVQLFSGASFSYPFGFYTYIHHSYTGRQYLDDGNTGSNEAYNLVNLKFGYKPPGKKIRPDFYFGIQNLFDTHYASMLLVNAPAFGDAAPRYYYPGQPRSFYAGVTLNF
ncbi:MAG: TonB-dependent receptor plug domain-containing protein [Bacteroidales bacterium]|nr:TonB-dependent receptor plug domain-containing protein [Bacteroidales bacterium]MBN2820231.1 TonB-dependent receptor plug domain-containing protein [Bacteroidales bacterium]